MPRRFPAIVATVLIIMLCIGGLSGCRYSDMLQEIIYSMDTDLVDTQNDNKPIDNNPDATDYTEDVNALENSSEADRQTEEEKDLAKQGQSQSDSLAAKSESTEYEVPTETNPESSTNDQGSGNGASQRQGGEGVNPTPSNNGSKTQVVDDHGNIVEVPTDISSVAAVGEAAVITRMLGGSGSLSATDQATKDNQLTTQVFSDVSNATTLWDTADATSLSDDAFQQLLTSKPQVVLACGSQTLLSEDQIGQYEEAGGIYLTLPSLTSYENIKFAVKIVGAMMSNPSSASLAETYASYVDDQIKTVKRSLAAINAGTKYTVFLNAWDDSATWSIYKDSSVALSGLGAATTYFGGKGDALTALFSDANVINTPSTYPHSTSSTVAQYALPMLPVYHSVTASGSLGSDSYHLNLFSVNGQTLGSDSFPAVIVTSDYMVNVLRSSLMWRVYDYVESADHRYSGIGFLDQDGIIVNSSISGEYQVLINPQGVGTWWNGSVESVLELPWLANHFFGTVDDETLREDIKGFYQTFYGYTLGDDQITSILNGS